MAETEPTTPPADPPPTEQATPGETIHFNGDVLDDPLVNGAVVGVEYDDPAVEEPEP